MAITVPEQRRTATTEPLLRVEGLSVRFAAFNALTDVDLEIRFGETVALAGENGAGKSTLIRCIGGDIAPTSGRVYLGGERVSSSPAAAARRGIAVVWQDLALCDNLDVASNLLLGNEQHAMLRSEAQFHSAAREQLRELGIPLADTTRLVASLSGGERQLLAVARAMAGDPRLLVLDEPTGALGVQESAQVERLTANVRARGTTVLLVSHDIDQMFRLADRIVVLRHGRVAAELDTAQSHPDEVISVISGQESDSSARRQLSRLHGLADRLAAADPSSSLPLILSALGGALGASQLCLHLADGDRLRTEADLSVPAALTAAWTELPFGADGGPVGLAASSEETVVEFDVHLSPAWARWLPLAADARIRSSWSVPVIGTDTLLGVITVFRESPGYPPRHELRLANLYAGYIASAVEHEHLLGEVTARNRALETIRDVLETLAGPVPLTHGLVVVLQALCQGLQADRVGLVTEPGASQAAEDWLVVNASGAVVGQSAGLLEAAALMAAGPRRDGKARSIELDGGGSCLAVRFLAPDGGGVLLAEWQVAGDSTGGDRADGRCGELASSRPRAPGVRARARGGERAAPLAGAPARVPLAPQPRAAHAADGDRRLRVEPDGPRRDLGPRVRAALPQPHRCGVGTAQPARRRPARLLGDRVLDDAPAARLVRARAGARRRGGLRRHRPSRLRAGQLPAGPAGDLGRPRPARAGLRQPARERAAPQPRRHARHGPGVRR